MFSRRLMLSMTLALATPAAGRAQTCNLTETPLVDGVCRVELKMTFDGEIKLRQDGKDVVLRQTADARHDYLERGLEVAPSGLLQRAARFYTVAEARLAVESGPRKLRPARALVIAQRLQDQVVAYSLKGLFSREEFELTEHFDTLALPGLLPRTEVAVGATWPLTSTAAQALCELDGLTVHDLVGKLESIKDDAAQIRITGTAAGIDLGAAVKISVAATATFDLKAKRVVALEWKQQDERDQGPVSPALKADVITTVKRTPIESVPNEVHDFALVKMPDKGKPPVEELTQIQHDDPLARYGLSYNRDWHLVARTEDNVIVLRLMDRGDFVTQVTITPWKKAAPGSHVTPQEFQAAMAATPGWKQDKLQDQGTVASEHKYWIYRLAATGTFDGEEAVQYFYLVAGPEGDQTVLTFTMTPKQAQKLEARDITLVRGLIYPTVSAQK